MATNKKAVPSTEGTTKWIVNQDAITIEQAGQTTGEKITLSTAGKFLDRNIEVSAPVVTVADGVIVANAPTIENASASIAADGFTPSVTTTNYKITLSTSDGSAKSNAGVTTAGYVETTDTASSAVTVVPVTVTNDTIYIPESDVTPTVESLTAPVVTTSTSTSGFTAATGTTGFSITVTNESTEGSVKAKATVSGVGMVDADDTSSSAASVITPTVTIDGGNTAKTIYLKETSYANKATAGTDYTDISKDAPVLVSGDYLYINEGYNTAQKISLAKLVPDESNLPTTGTESPWMYKTVSAYNNDGKLIAGTMQDAVVVGDEASASASSTKVVLVETAPTGTEGADYFTITASGSGNSKVTSAGYIAEGSLPASTAATKDYYVAAATHTNTAAVDSLNAPSGTYGASTTVSDTTYDISTITTSQPSSGKVYITINPTLQKTKGSVKATASCVNTKGYCLGDTTIDTSAASEIDFNGTKGSASYIEVFTGDFIIG